MRKLTIVLVLLMISDLTYGQDPAIHVTEEGNVAIGAYSAASKLHVWNGGILTDSYFGLYGGANVIPTEGAFIALTQNLPNYLAIYSDGAPQFSVGVFGNDPRVGIGLGHNQLNHPFHVKGWCGSGNPIVKLESTGEQCITEYRTNVTEPEIADYWHVGINGPYPGRFYMIPVGKGGGANLFFDQSGYNGFGIAEPKATLHIRQFGYNGVENDGFRITCASHELDIYGRFGGGFVIDATYRLTLNPSGGYIRIGDEITADYPLHMASGAHVTIGGVWTDASSRELKENIRDITNEEALEALLQLDPKRYNYKLDKEEEYLGFIAEDVPELVATNDRKSLSPMDIVTLLTKVVQQQQEKIEELEERLNSNQEK